MEFISLFLSHLRKMYVYWHETKKILGNFEPHWCCLMLCFNRGSAGIYRFSMRRWHTSISQFYGAPFPILNELANADALNCWKLEQTSGARHILRSHTHFIRKLGRGARTERLLIKVAAQSHHRSECIYLCPRFAQIRQRKGSFVAPWSVAMIAK